MSSAFSIALHSGLVGHFLNLKMTIKGDPFWLFPAPIVVSEDSTIFNSSRIINNSTDAAINHIRDTHIRTLDSVNLYGSDNFFLVRFRSPRVFNTDEGEDGTQPNTDVETYSGVYKVTNVTSVFEGGKFTQELTAILDPNILMINISDLIEQDAQRRDVPTSPKAFLPDAKFADARDKNLRIKGTDSVKGLVEDAAENITTTAGTINKASNIPSAIPNIISGFPDNYT
jgi:hypothetical protein